MERYVSYSRVSTISQGASGLGLEAQHETIRSHIGNDVELLAEYVEVESGRRSDRPELKKALDHASEARSRARMRHGPGNDKRRSWGSPGIPSI